MDIEEIDLEEYWLSWEQVLQKRNSVEYLYLLKELRQKGYHKELRLGMSMHWIILSRTLSHLKKEDSFVSFWLEKKKTNVSYNKNGTKVDISYKGHKPTEQVFIFLDELKKEKLKP